MVNKSSQSTAVKKYKKTGIVAALVVAIAGLGVWAISATGANKSAPVAEVIESVSADAYVRKKKNMKINCAKN